MLRVTIGGTELVKAAFLKAAPECITPNLRISIARCGSIPVGFLLPSIYAFLLDVGLSLEHLAYWLAGDEEQFPLGMLREPIGITFG